MKQTTTPDNIPPSGLETILQFAAANAQLNQYPASAWAVRGLHRNRKIHGLSDAFVMAGRRVLVNRIKFYELLNQSATRQASPAFVKSEAAKAGAA